MVRLENVLKISLQNVLKTPWRGLEDVLKTSWRRLQNVLKTSWKRLEVDVLKTSWRHMAKTNILVLTKTSWRRLLKTKTKDVFIKTNVCWVFSEADTGGVLQNFANSLENACARVSSLKKLHAGACKIIKKETLAQVFSSEFSEIFKYTFFTEHLRMTASVFCLSIYWIWFPNVVSSLP